LLDQATALVPHPARPAVVASFAVALLSQCKLFLHLIEGYRRNSRSVETRSLLGEVVF
jgi:hypothetical protein